MQEDFQSIIQGRPSGRVLALCLHPALDVTVYTEQGREVGRRCDLGGKAVNFARMLHALGADVLLILPGDAAGRTETLLTGCGFDYEIIPTNLSLRENYKYVDADGSTHEQNGNAGSIFPQHLQQLIHRVLHICRTRQISHLALCGSFPQGVEKGVYKYFTEQANALNISCVTDASGESLSLAVQAKPRLIKPNIDEFCAMSAQDFSLLKTLPDVQNAIGEVFSANDVPILCSLDKKGAIYAGPEGTYTVSGRTVDHVASFAGAGDTMLASFVYARDLCSLPVEQSLRFACAAATAKVTLPANSLPCAEQIYAEWIQTTITKKGGA